MYVYIYFGIIGVFKKKKILSMMIIMNSIIICNYIGIGYYFIVFFKYDILCIYYYL